MVDSTKYKVYVCVYILLRSVSVEYKIKISDFYIYSTELNIVLSLIHWTRGILLSGILYYSFCLAYH